MIDKAWVRHCLTGPIASIRTPFKRDGAIDFEGLRCYLDFVIEAGSRTVLLTAGDSHFLALSDEEIGQVTKVTVEHTGDRAMVVAADRHYDTRQALAFADYCHDLGVDVLMLMPPDWAASCTSESLVQHYTAVAVHIPVMLVTNHLIPRGEAFGLETIRQARDAVDHIVAVKDDFGGTFARRMAMLVHDKWAVFSGGQKQFHLSMHDYGCDGYLSTFITFKPEIAHRYWKGIETDDRAAAVKIIREWDMPFFDLIGAQPGGFDAGLHGVQELIGTYQRWRRPPYHSLTDEQMAHLARDLGKIGIL